jgi:uncharacterized membrane protein YeaQ/YmgE (transglycosylase-associated protein family)
MHILLFLLFGLVVGVVARWIVPGRQSGGWLTSLVIGVLGAFVGGFLGRALGFHDDGQVAGFLMSVAGAVILLVCFRAISNRSSTA